MQQISELSVYQYSKKYNVNYRTVRKIASSDDEFSKQQLIERQLANKIFPRFRNLKEGEKQFYLYTMIYRQRLVYHHKDVKKRRQIKKDYYNDYKAYGLNVSLRILDNGWESIVEGVLHGYI